MKTTLVIGVLAALCQYSDAYWSRISNASPVDNLYHPKWYRPTTIPPPITPPPTTPPPTTAPPTTPPPTTAPPTTAPPTTPPPTTPPPTTPPPTTSKFTLEEIRKCTLDCQVLKPDVNLLCGSDGVTYMNMGQFLCAKNCGADITVLKFEKCSSGSTPGLSIDQEMLRCVQKCPVKSEFQPVCGTNQVTYANIERLNCAKQCGKAVDVDKMSPCQKEVDLTNTMSKMEVDICVQLCPASPILDSVCGTDLGSYINKEHLECAQKCGRNVKFSSRGFCQHSKPEAKCPGPVVPEPNAAKPLTPAELNACFQQCPLTREDNPVCGTDGVTYTNPGWLLCSQSCGINVKVKKFASCESTLTSNKDCPAYHPPTTFKSCMLSCPTTELKAPVCGSNRVTYRNEDELLCAKRCGADVTMTSTQACFDVSTTTTSTTTEPNSAESAPDDDRFKE